MSVKARQTFNARCQLHGQNVCAPFNREKLIYEGRLKEKVALVTGGSRGLGRAIAEWLAPREAAVAINYSSNMLTREKRG